MSLSIPNDVLVLVGDYLEDHQDRYNLVFVCRHFHDLFLCLVYRAATLKSCLQAQSFLGSILRRPELARAVRRLSFEDWASEIAPSGDLTLFIDYARSISHSEEEHKQWEQDLRDGVEEAWIALSLPLASNLSHLRLVYPRQNAYLDRTLQRAMKGERPFHTQPGFRKLQEVSLSHHQNDQEDKVGSYSPSQILPFFQLPSMRTFSADSVVESSSSQEAENNEESKDPSEAPLPRSSPVSEIVLNTSNGSQGMQSLVETCAELKSFKYQHSDSEFLADGYQPAAFYRSLEGSKKTLETLWLDSYGNHMPFTLSGLNETHDEWFGSLADFTALRDIRIRLPNLLDIRYQMEPAIPLTDCLPKAIESLYVEGCKENNLNMLVGQLKTVLSRHQNQFSGLRRLDIEGFFHDEDDEEASGYDATMATNGDKFIKPRVHEMVEPLQMACAATGVELHVRDRVCPATAA